MIDNYIFQQISTISVNKIEILFLTKRSFDKLQMYIKDILFKRNGKTPTIFSPFNVNNRFVGSEKMKGIAIMVSNGHKAIVYRSNRRKSI